MPRILPDLTELGYVPVLEPRKGTTGVGQNNQVRVLKKPPEPEPGP